MNSSGIFITFEGGDGAGKTTQTDLLARWLTAVRGREVVRTFEPGDTELGKAIRNLLLHGADLSARAEALLFAADRAQHVATLVRPALQRGAVVLCDRYIDSSVAYQGAGRELAGSEVRDLSDWATQHLTPDLTIVLDIDPEMARTRQAGAPDRMERESLNFHRAVRAAFLKQAAAAPERYLVLDATASVEEIQTLIQNRVADLV